MSMAVKARMAAVRNAREAVRGRTGSLRKIFERSRAWGCRMDSP